MLGADGFIGSQVVRAALAALADVTAISLNDPWRLQGLSGFGLRHRRDLGCWWEPGYLPGLRSVLSGSDALALLAYRPPPGGAGEAERLEHELSVNAAGAERIATAATDLGLRVVFASSADVYGPWHEAPVSEDTAPSPATPYAEAKLRAEELVGTRVLSLRIGTVFGPGELGPRAIPTFLRALARGEQPVVDADGSDVRDYVYVGDVAGAIVNACFCAQGADADVTSLNVGSGVGRSTLEILRSLCALMGARFDFRLHGSERPPSKLVLDTSRARRAVGFEPSSHFQTRLEEEARWLLGPDYRRASSCERSQRGNEQERSRP